MSGLNDVTIVASNVAELRDFYLSLGLPLVLELPEGLVVFDVGGADLAIHAGPDRPIGVMGIGIAVDDLEPFQQRLRESGVPFEGPKPLRPGRIGLHLNDPNGNVVELLVRAH